MVIEYIDSYTSGSPHGTPAPQQASAADPRLKRGVLLVGDFFNLGDAFLAEVEAEYWRAAGSAEIVLAPYQPAPDEIARHFADRGLPVLSLRRHSTRVMRACIGAEVLIGGGHAIREAVSHGWLARALCACAIARLSGGKVRLVGAGATPLRAGWKRVLWGVLLRLCQRLCVRDEQSAEHLRSMFPSQASKVRVTDDIAFLRGVTETLPASSGDERGVCVVSAAVDQGEGRGIDSSRLLGLLDQLHRRDAICRVCFLAHDVRGLFDQALCDDLVASAHHTITLPSSIATGSAGLRLVQTYRNASVILTARLHGLIVGALLGKPVVCIGDADGKLRPFAQRFAYPYADLAAPDVAAEAAGVIAYLRNFDAKAVAVAVRQAESDARKNFL